MEAIEGRRLVGMRPGYPVPMNRSIRVLVLLGVQALLGVLLIVALATEGYRAWGVTGAVLMPAVCTALAVTYILFQLRRKPSAAAAAAVAVPARKRSPVGFWLFMILVFVVGSAAYITAFFPQH